MKKFFIFCLILICITLATKVAFVFSDAMPRDDDLYYWYWFHNPFFSYPDHPPLIGYFVGLSVLIFGHHIPSLALGGIFLYLFLTILGYFLAANLFIPRSKLAGILFATMVSTVPYFAGISVIMSPDTVLAFFAFLTLFAYHNAFFREPFSLRAWLLAGILLSLALFSKLTTIFIGGAIFLYACLSKNRRQILSNPRFYISFFPSVFVGIVLLISDASHDWIMLKYTAERANKGIHPERILQFTLNQFLHYSPLFFAMCLALPVVTIKKYYEFFARTKEKMVEKWPTTKPNWTENVVGKEEACFFFGCTGFFCFLMVVRAVLTTRMLNHWSGFFIMPASILVIIYSVHLFSRPRWSKIVLGNFVFVCLYCAIITFHISYGVLDHRYDENRNDPFRQYNILLKKFSLWVHGKSGKYPEENSDWLYRYDTLKQINPESFAQFYQENMQKDIPIITSTFRPAVYLEFFLKPNNRIIGLTKNNLSPENHPAIADEFSIYDILMNKEKIVGQEAYFLAQWLSRDPLQEKKNTEKWLKNNFLTVRKIKNFQSERLGKIVGNFTLYKVKKKLVKS